MRRPVGTEDDSHLGHWVAEVTQRWASHRNLTGGQRRALFARLLSALTRLRTVTGSTASLTGADPAAYADTTARDEPSATVPAGTPSAADSPGVHDG